MIHAGDAFLVNARQKIVHAYFITVDIAETVGRGAIAELAARATEEMERYRRLWPGVVEHVRIVESILTHLGIPLVAPPRSVQGGTRVVGLCRRHGGAAGMSYSFTAPVRLET